jgi:hypothetical protein
MEVSLFSFKRGFYKDTSFFSSGQMKFDELILTQ